MVVGFIGLSIQPKLSGFHLKKTDFVCNSNGICIERSNKVPKRSRNRCSELILASDSSSPSDSKSSVDLAVLDVLVRDACKRDDAEAVRRVFSGLSKTNQKALANWTNDETGGSASLHICAHRGNSDAASVLLEFGADPDVLNQAGNTPLQFAALKGHVRVARELLKNGANFSHLSADKATALDYAEEWFQENMVSRAFSTRGLKKKDILQRFQWILS